LAFGILMLVLMLELVLVLALQVPKAHPAVPTNEAGDKSK